MYFLIFFIESMRQRTHVVGHMSHKVIPQGALSTSEGEDIKWVPENSIKNKSFVCPFPDNESISLSAILILTLSHHIR